MIYLETLATFAPLLAMIEKVSGVSDA